ncbi:hypothetical protein [Halorubrum sp. F4]|uniref:hypothetical protein n=1 Tax=Halorubrum sp. F4 TaxID=2989715 RepID=UPI002480BE45|nr:hypothetical protein [Halorubrum sp. F4]
MTSNGYGPGSRRGSDEEKRPERDGSGGPPAGSVTDVAGSVDPVGPVDPFGVSDPDGNVRDGTHGRSGLGAYGSDRWARILSAVTPAAMVAAVGIRIGSVGDRLATDVAARLDPLPVGVDAAALSAVAGVVHYLSVLLAVGVACAVGWLVLSASVRLVANAAR